MSDPNSAPVHSAGNTLTIEIADAQPLSPHSKALLDAGRAQFLDSIPVAREYCRSMITVSLTAVPVFAAVINLTIPTSSALDSSDAIMILIPPCLFLISAILFTVGYFPAKSEVLLDVIESIKADREATMHRRQLISKYGVGSFLLGMALGITVFVIQLMRHSTSG